MTQAEGFTPDPTQGPASAPDPDPAVDPEQDPALGPAQEIALDPSADPAQVEPEDPAFEAAEEGADTPGESSELEETVETSEDEYDRPADDVPGEQSIDDALETDRVATEGGDSRNTDGFQFETTRDHGLEDAAAAEQGNRDEDVMTGEGDQVDEVSQLAGSDADAAGTDRDLADPDDVGTEDGAELADPGPDAGPLP